eukprot:TRINITY_DN4563_c0_g2_i5.p1 TRINITY_DN4563_c0_g2~~TRINITY_DN4563_c0_g2_i5.p1  ORF type:complete len:451 (+),score=72.54 TRINITY_DN4563_c0_g2_i5:118-1470(+)
MIRRPPRSTLSSSSAASDVYKRQLQRDNQALRRENQALRAMVGSLQERLTGLSRCIATDAPRDQLLNLAFEPVRAGPVPVIVTIMDSAPTLKPSAIPQQPDHHRAHAVKTEGSPDGSPDGSLEFSLDELWETTWDEGTTTAWNSTSDHGVGCSTGVTSCERPSSGRLDDYGTSYLARAIEQATAVPSPWCLRFEPVVEDAYTVWWARHQQHRAKCTAMAVLLATFWLNNIRIVHTGKSSSVTMLGVWWVRFGLGSAPDLLMRSFFCILIASGYLAGRSGFRFKLTDLQYAKAWEAATTGVLVCITVLRMVSVYSIVNQQATDPTPKDIHHLVMAWLFQLSLGLVAFRPPVLCQVFVVGVQLAAGILWGRTQDAVLTAMDTTQLLPSIIGFLGMCAWLSHAGRDRFVEMFKVAEHTRWNELSSDGCVLTRDQVGKVMESGDEFCTTSKEML